jgi:outer membrane biogenesis lipoprotein LolB
MGMGSLLSLYLLPRAVFLLLAACCSFASGGVNNYNTSDAAARQLQWGNARATWYGQPNGAGPYDNGTYAIIYNQYVRS